MNDVDRLLNSLIDSPVMPAMTFALAWFAGGTLLDLAFRRERGRFYAVGVAALGVGFSAPVAIWFSWARYRLRYLSDWIEEPDAPQSFPYPDALLLEWIEALTVPPPPGYLDIDSGYWALYARLIFVVAGCWAVVGAFVGLALPPRWILAGVSRTSNDR